MTMSVPTCKYEYPDRTKCWEQANKATGYCARHYLTATTARALPRHSMPVLDEREKTYGNYSKQAAFARELKDVVLSGITSSKNMEITPQMHESLDMICTKISRIIFGDPNYIDSWKDIAGYATLIVDILEGQKDKA